MSKRIFDRIRRMWRMRRLIKCLDKYKDPNMGSHWVAQAKPTQYDFATHLLFKTNFMKDWRDTLIDIFYKIRMEQRPMSKLGSKLSQQRLKDIFDVIQNCIDRKLIQYSNPPIGHGYTESTIWTDNKSREFLRPLRFIEACAREFGFIASIATSFIVGVGGTLLIIFWDKIKVIFQQ